MKASRFVWSGVLAVGVFAALPAVVKAEPRVGITVVLGGGRGHNGGYGYNTSGAFRYGFERGRSEGAARGYGDGRQGSGGDFRRDSWYQGGYRGYRGYRGGMGSRGEYAAGYRQGYAMAYRQACDSARSGGRDRGYGYGNDGRDQGYGYGNDGRDDDRYRSDPQYEGGDWRR